MTNFYSKLSYSFGNEDWRTEVKALQVQETDTIVCVTASGDRPLNLLTKKCKQLISVDANPIQTFLLDLKRAAMSNLSYDQYAEFLGLRASHQIVDLFEKIEKDLHKESRSFWRSQLGILQKGVIYQGQVEKLCSKTSQLIKLIRGSGISQLTEFNNIEEQRDFIKKKWDKPLWRSAFKLLLNPKYSKYYIDDPGLTNHIGQSIVPGEYIFNRMTESLYAFLAKENPLFSLIVNGFVLESGYSPYLLESHYLQIKSNLNHLSYTTDNMVSFLESREASSIDKFSFSDIASYMDERSFNRMLRAMIRTGKPGSRFCIRQFLSDHQIDESLLPYIEREPLLEYQLEKEDRCFVYRFMTGTIKKRTQQPIEGLKKAS